MGRTAAAVGLAAINLVVLVVSLAVRRPLQRRWFAGTGLEEWRAEAHRLSWRDRLRLERANSRGRAASPELAALAAERGRTMTAIVERQQTRQGWRRFHRGMAVAASLLVILYAAPLLIGDSSRLAWLSLAGWSVAAVMIAAIPHLQRRQLRNFRRSVELNEALLERGTTSGGL